MLSCNEEALLERRSRRIFVSAAFSLLCLVILSKSFPTVLLVELGVICSPKGWERTALYFKHMVKMLDIMLGICSWEPASKKDMNSKKNPNNKIIAQQEVSKIFAAGRGQEDRMDLHIQFIYYPKIN